MATKPQVNLICFRLWKSEWNKDKELPTITWLEKQLSVKDGIEVIGDMERGDIDLAVKKLKELYKSSK